MEINKTTPIRDEMARKLALDKLKETLVNRVSAFMAEQKPGNMGDTQFKNLVGVAQASHSVVEIEAFIRYQMGRDNWFNNWRFSYSVGGVTGSFGEQLIKEIQEVKQLAEVARPDDKQFVMLVLAYYFGYLAWRVKYIEKKRMVGGVDGRPGGVRR